MVVRKLKLVRQQVIKQLRLVIVQLIIKQQVIKQLELVIVQLIIKQLKVAKKKFFYKILLLSEQQLISQLDSIELYQRNDQLEHIRYTFPNILKGYIQFSIRLRNNQSQIVHVGPR
jgi:hypothetical protein